VVVMGECLGSVMVVRSGGVRGYEKNGGRAVWRNGEMRNRRGESDLKRVT
jgi:hypothetical protein